MKLQFSKKIKKIVLCVFIFVFLTLPDIAKAVGVQPSTIGVPGVSGSGGNFGATLENLFKWGVGLTASLAVVMIVVGGVQYMGSESLFGKDEGKKKIMAALGGLLIALTSILILTTIFGEAGGPFKINLKF